MSIEVNWPTMKTHLFLLSFIVAFSSWRNIATATPAKEFRPSDPRVLDGKTVNQYPTLLLTKRTKYFNIYWTTLDDSNHAPNSNAVVNQSRVLAMSDLMEKRLTGYVEKIESEGKRNFPNWEKDVSSKLYPFNLQLRLTIDGQTDRCDDPQAEDTNYILFDSLGRKVGRLKNIPTIRMGADYAHASQAPYWSPQRLQNFSAI